MSDSVLIERAGASWTFVLNRPEKRNALSPDMVESLLTGIQQAHDSKADMLIFRGEGKSFCAGFDFSDFVQLSEGDLLWRFVRIEQLLQLIHGSPALTVALAQGKNFGAGVDLMASCKHRVATPDATFRMPGLKFGLVLGTRRLGELIGKEPARQIQQVAATMMADQARDLHLVNAIEPIEGWQSILEGQRAVALALAPQARESLYRVLGDSGTGYQTDMADLVQSVVTPGLKQRIASYRAGG